MSDLVGNPEDRFPHDEDQIRRVFDDKSVRDTFRYFSLKMGGYQHAVQSRMISGDNFFVFLRLFFFFCLMLLYVT